MREWTPLRIIRIPHHFEVHRIVFSTKTSRRHTVYERLPVLSRSGLQASIPKLITKAKVCFAAIRAEKYLIVHTRLAKTTIAVERETNTSLARQYQDASAGPSIKLCGKSGPSLQNLKITAGLDPVPGSSHLVCIKKVILVCLSVLVCLFQARACGASSYQYHPKYE